MNIAELTTRPQALRGRDLRIRRFYNVYTELIRIWTVIVANIGGTAGNPGILYRKSKYGTLL